MSITKKLSSRSGASLAIGMLFFLLCLMVGAVIITAASVNAGRLGAVRTAQQDYFTVSSAAQLLRQELGEARFVAEETAVYNRGDSGRTELSYDYMVSDHALADMLETNSRLVYSGSGAVEGSLDVLVDGLEMVTADYELTTDYLLILHLYLGDATEPRQRMTLTLEPDMRAISQQSYYDVDYFIGYDAEGQPIYDSYTVATTVTTTTVNWDSGLIEKEG